MGMDGNGPGGYVGGYVDPRYNYIFCVLLNFIKVLYFLCILL